MSQKPIEINSTACAGEHENEDILTRLRFLPVTGFGHVSSYTMLSMDRALAHLGVPALVNHQTKAQIFLSKVASRLRLVKNFSRSTNSPVFVSFMGFSEYRTLPFSYWTEIVPYCFDCWPAFYPQWRSFFERHRTRIAFFSARQSAEYFADLLPDMKSVWMPEATDPSGYDPSKSWGERNIDVLEMGRKYDELHSSITEPLSQAGKVHLFERVKGELIFPDRESLVQGMAHSKISVCFPSSQTHPGAAGSVETVTHRYFESMASKCLLVGHAPQELIDLFGYNPVVEIQHGSEFEQIESLLTNQEPVQALIEKNYLRLMEVGRWETRVASILHVLDETLL